MVNLQEDSIEMLKKTSRTFFVPISFLPSGLQEAVAAAYLCMRAIDEIEDHPRLPSEVKNYLLQSISQVSYKNDFNAMFQPYSHELPEVSLRLGDWIRLCPETIRPTVWKSTQKMSAGMGKWVSKQWTILNEDDLNDYTYYVAGLVGVMLSDIWKWYDGTETDRDLAISFGRGLQAVNIIRNYREDLERGVDFLPEGWDLENMFRYARRNLARAEQYHQHITSEPIVHFCKIPLALAHQTLNVIEAGEAKLSRDEVNQIVRKVTT